MIYENSLHMVKALCINYVIMNLGSFNDFFGIYSHIVIFLVKKGPLSKTYDKASHTFFPLTMICPPPPSPS